MKTLFRSKTLLFSTVFVFCISLAFGAGTWVAKVDSKTITSVDLTTILSQQQLLAEIGSGRSLAGQFKNKKFQKQILEMQIMQQLMVDEIKQINTTKKFINAGDILVQSKSLAAQIEKALWIRAYTDKVLRPQVSISKQAINKFFNENKEQFKNASKEDAQEFIKEELTLQQIQPLIMQLQTKIKTESNVTVNDKFFN